jgi:hypothetical protein
MHQEKTERDEQHDDELESIGGFSRLQKPEGNGQHGAPDKNA